MGVLKQIGYILNADSQHENKQKDIYIFYKKITF